MVARTGRFGGSRTMGDATARPDLTPALNRADPKDGHGPAEDVIDRRWNGQKRVSRQLLPGKHRLNKGLRLIADEPISPVVKRIAKLIRTIDWLEAVSDGIKPKIVVLDGNPGAVWTSDGANHPSRCRRWHRRSNDRAPKSGC